MATSPIDDLLSRLEAVTPAGNGRWKARCPAHDDRNPSLSITAGDDGTALVRCWAGCTTESVCESIGLTLSDLFPDRAAGGGSRPAPKRQTRTYPTGKASIADLERRNGKASKVWRYQDALGNVIGAVARWDRPDGKDIRPVSRRSDGLWVVGAMPDPRPLYCLPTLADAQSIYVCEGEKAADAARSLGLIATTSAGGANAAGKTDWSPLAGKSVVILPDNNEPGERYADDVCKLLLQLDPAPSVKVVRLPGLPEGGDIYDWIAAGGTREGLLRLVEAADLVEPEPTEPTPEPWPELIPFVDSQLPEFPSDVLPEVLRDWVEAVSESVQVPADMPALLSLAVCSYCLCRRIEIEGGPGWREPTNLYTCVLMPPGSRKSAVFAECLAPLENLEAALQEAERESVARAASERRRKEKMLARYEKQAVEATKPADREHASHEADRLAAELASEPIPVLPRLLVDNATSEVLETLLAQQGGRIMAASSEGGVFDVMAGKYTNGAASIDVYLKGHAGDNLRTDRIGRESVRIDKPTLTLAYAIQPDVIEGLADNQSMSGRGLWARFLWAMPASNVGYRDVNPPPIPDEVKHAYHETVERLYREAEDGIVLTLSPSAAELFSKWKAKAEKMKREGEELETIVEWGSKIEGATLRIAAVLHSVEHGPRGEIGPETIRNAILIARYLIPHAEAVLTMASAASKVIGDAQYVWRLIERNGCRTFTKSEVQQAGRRRFPRATDIDEPLMELCRRGYITRIEQDRKAGRPSEIYVLNPNLCTENTENPSQRSRKGSFQDIQYRSPEFENADYAAEEIEL